MLQLPAGEWHLGQWVLECVDIGRETHDVKTFHFRILSGVDDAAQLCFHRPGQFVTLRLRHGQMLVPRSYTICSSPSRPLLIALTIKRDPHGLVSRFMHDVLRVGDRIPATGPGGSFDLTSVDPKSRIVMLSGGSGITPLMSMLRYIYDTRALGFSVTFLHSARTEDDIIFRRELELIAERTNTNLSFICERGSAPNMETGLLTRRLLEVHAPDIHNCTVLTCGPSPYMTAVRAMLGDMGFDWKNYHEESFGNPAERENPPAATPETLTVDRSEILPSAPRQEMPSRREASSREGPNEITFTVSGKTVGYRHGQTILEIATSLGIPVATNCQMGLCGTCKAFCETGEVRMDDTDGLNAGEQENGMVLTCCGRPNGRVRIAL